MAKRLYEVEVEVVLTYWAISEADGMEMADRAIDSIGGGYRNMWCSEGGKADEAANPSDAPEGAE